MSNEYVAHALMRYVGNTGERCGFRGHGAKPASTEWEFVTLVDLDRGADFVQAGMDVEHMDQALWEQAAKAQDVGVLRFRQQFFCCEACALAALLGHLHKELLARSMMARARENKRALLLVSRRSDQVPFILGNIPLPIRAKDVALLLQQDLLAREEET